MKLYLRTCFSLLLAVSGCYGQAVQPPATPDELQYLRFLLMSVASVDHHPSAIKSFEDGLVKQFGLTNQESAAIHAAAQELNALLRQLRQSGNTIPGRSAPSPAQAAVLSALSAQREQRLETLANRILNQVRPETAARLRSPARVLATKGNR